MTKSQRNGLWVPPFAGTTESESILVPTRHCRIERFACSLLQALFICLVPAVLAGAAGVRAAAAAAEVPHHEMVLTLDPAKGAVKIRDRIRVSGRTDITLRLASWMRIESIRIDGQAAAAPRTGSALRLPLPGTQQHQVEVMAEGILAASTSADEDHSASDPLMSAEGIYLPGWADWFPETGDAAMTFTLAVETPQQFRAAATGKFESEMLGAEQNTALFSSTRLQDRPSVFAGPYAVTEKSIGGVRIRTYFHQSIARLADDYITTADRYIRHFAEQIGPYPFADFQIVSAPLPVGLGFPGLTYIDRRILPLPFIKDRSFAHEVLHNWWGNGVVADDAGGNWSEGLTTYMADHALAAARDPNEAAEMRLGWLRDYAALPAERDMPVVQFRSKTHDASQVVGYGKIALIFQMLRDEVGDAAFKDALRRFWDAHQFKSASWADLRSAFEAAAGTDLGWFFEQWTKRTGAPRIELTNVAASIRGNAAGSGYGLDLTLAQSGPAYRLKVPVTITTLAGTVHTYVPLDAATATAHINFDAAPVSVRIDPENTLFRRLLPGEAPPIVRDVALDENARTLVLYDEPARAELARQLAERMLDAPAPSSFIAPEAPPAGPLLVIGPARRVDELMARLAVPARPDTVAGKGSARAWMANRPDGKAVLFVEAESADDLQTALRFLPHYRSKSFVVFEGARVVSSGVLPAAHNPLTVQLRH